MRQKRLPTLPEAYVVYAETCNGREIREAVAEDGRRYYWVQPYADNFWHAHRTPEAALRYFERSKRAAHA